VERAIKKYLQSFRAFLISSFHICPPSIFRLSYPYQDPEITQVIGKLQNELGILMGVADKDIIEHSCSWLLQYFEVGISPGP
jgi:hypothetical protein